MPHELQIADRWSLPLPELSGLSHCRDAAHAGQLLAVGDRTFGLYRGPVRSETPPDPVDLDALVRDLRSAPDERSQWEAVTADASGRVFVLQEHPGQVFVFAPALDALVAALALDIPDEDGWQRAWVEDENARGEAFALLKNGHVLVVKQKKPRLIEFGPREHEAAGLSPDTLLSPDEAFEIGGRELSPLASWGLGDADAKRFENVSDAAVSDEGALYLVSSKSRRIARVEPAAPGDDRATLTDFADLPSEIPTAEALTFIEPGLALVGSDEPAKGGANIFTVRPPGKHGRRRPPGASFERAP